MKVVLLESDDFDWYWFKKFDEKEDYFWHTKTYRKTYNISIIRYWWAEFIAWLFWDVLQSYLFKVKQKGNKQ